MITLSKQDEYEGSLRDLMPDLTPMLDILFILLLFLMLSSGFVFKSLTLDLPDGSNHASYHKDNDSIILEIHRDFYLFKDKKIHSFEQLQTVITAHNFNDKKLVIAGDKDISLNRFLQILTYLESQHIKTANILMHDKNN